MGIEMNGTEYIVAIIGGAKCPVMSRVKMGIEERKNGHTLVVTNTKRNRAHEDLNGADVASIRRGTVGLSQTHGFTKLLLGDGSRGVDFVSQNDERNVAQLVGGKKALLRKTKKVDTNSIAGTNRYDGVTGLAREKKKK